VRKRVFNFKLITWKTYGTMSYNHKPSKLKQLAKEKECVLYLCIYNSMEVTKAYMAI